MTCQGRFTTAAKGSVSSHEGHKNLMRNKEGSTKHTPAQDEQGCGYRLAGFLDFSRPNAAGACLNSDVGAVLRHRLHALDVRFG